MSSTEDDVLVASIGELMESFRSAMRALVPIADAAKLNWRDEFTSPDWERLSQSLFDAFVRGPIAGDRGRAAGDAPLAVYDIDVPSYGDRSWLAFRCADQPELALVRVLSVDAPFDTLQGVEVDPQTGFAGDHRNARWETAEFVLIRRSKAGLLTRATSVVAEE